MKIALTREVSEAFERCELTHRAREAGVQVMVEGPDETTIRHWARAIAAAIRKALG